MGQMEEYRGLACFQMLTLLTISLSEKPAEQFTVQRSLFTVHRNQTIQLIF